MSLSPQKTSSTPDLTTTSEYDSAVTLRKRKQPECRFTENLNALASELRNTLKSFRSDVDASLATINTNITGMKNDLELLTVNTTEIRNELNTLRAEHESFKRQISILENKNKDCTQKLVEFEASVQSSSSNCEDIMKKMNSLESRMNSAERAGNLISSLEAKIDNIEQQARTCNIEICNIPERRGENLITLVESIGQKIKFPITQNNIISVHRVPQKVTNKDRPKNIVVRLTSVHLRDNILSAYRLARGLKSDQLGISGTPHTIYLNEHLTINKKHLFRESRLEASKNNFKHCWIKHSTILVRRTDVSPIFSIRSKNDFTKFMVSDGDGKVPE